MVDILGRIPSLSAHEVDLGDNCPICLHICTNSPKGRTHASFVLTPFPQDSWKTQVAAA